jgi:hypothetical protein
MKRILAMLMTVMATGGLAFASADVGKPAPDFTAKDINGKQSNSVLKGKIVMHESYNMDCPTQNFSNRR